MNMQAMLAQAQKMKRELEKEYAALAQDEFYINKNGLVTVTLYGDKKLKSVDIEKDALEADNKEMIEEAIVLAYNECIKEIDEAIEEINTRITGRPEGLGF